MSDEKPRKTPPATPASDDPDVAELAKLTKDFAAALRRLIPAAERASKRGKHTLLRLISRKLPRLATPPAAEHEDTENDDDNRAIVFGYDGPTTREECLANAAAALKKGDQVLADYWTNNAAKHKPQSEGGGPTKEEEERLAAADATFRERNASPDTSQKPAKTQGKTKVSENPAPAPCCVPATRPTSGAPRSANEEPWPGQASFPRPKRGPMRRR
jgi:hypothetical protein